MCESQLSCADTDRGRRGVRTPLKKIGFLSNTGGPDPLKTTKLKTVEARIQCGAIIGMQAKRHLNGVSLADR